MTETFVFESVVDFAVDSEKRTLTGILLPFGEVSRPAMDPNTYQRARFRFASANVDLPEDVSDVILNYGHDRESLYSQVGVGMALTKTDKGVLAKFKIARTPEGDRVLALAADRILKAFSAEVEGAFEDEKDGVRDAKKTVINGAAVVRKPAFAGAHITGVAASAAPDESNKENKMPEKDENGTISFSLKDGQELQAQVLAMTEKLAELEKVKIPVGPGMQQFQVAEEPIYRFGGTIPAPSGFDFATDLLAAGKSGDQAAFKRVQEFSANHLGSNMAPQFAVTTGDVNEVNQPTYRPDMFLDPNRFVPSSPLYDTFHKGSLSNVTPFFWSKLDYTPATGTEIEVEDHTEGQDPTNPGRLVTATGATVTPVPVSGQVHITREVADQGGNPQVSGMVWTQFERSMKLALESKTFALINASIASITALATIPTGTTGVEAGEVVEAGLIDLQFAADGYRFTNLFGAANLYGHLAAATYTASGEKVYPILNPQNRSGSATSKYSALDIAGYSMTPTASLGAKASTAPTTVTPASIMADSEAVQVWNSGLTRLDRLEESVEGWDMGVFAYFAGVVYDITGLRKILYTV